MGIEEKWKEILGQLATEKHSSLNTLVKKLTLDEVRAKTGKLPNVDDGVLAVLPEARPNALVYTAPVTGAKIVASPDGAGGWKGITFHPDRAGSLFAWTSDDLNLAPWARGKKVARAMMFVASRIDDEGLSHFKIPSSKVIVTARWKDGRWEGGWVTVAEKRQEWSRSGWSTVMDPGPFNCVVEARRMLNMLARTMTVAGGGLQTKIPL